MRNDIVARPSLWDHPPGVFSMHPQTPPFLLSRYFLRRSLTLSLATIRPAICGLHLFLRPRLLRHSDL